MAERVSGRRFGASGGGPVCDFCIGSDPNWVFPTNMFTIPGDLHHPTYVDSGEWGACAACKADVEAENYEAITTRLLLHMLGDLQPGEFVDHHSIEWHHRLVRAFRAERTGPAHWDPD